MNVFKNNHTNLKQAIMRLEDGVEGRQCVQESMRLSNDTRNMHFEVKKVRRFGITR